MPKRLLTIVAIVLAVAAGTFAQNIRTIRLTTGDDVGIFAAYYPVAASSAPAVLLVHGFATNWEEWGSFPTLLQQNGIASLAIDLRGHGESTRQITAQGPQAIDYHKFTPVDFQDMLLDLNAAVDWLSAQPGINKQRIGIVGSSVGANIALRYTLFNADLAAAVLLSPGINYKEVRTDDAMQKLGPMPLRVIVSRDDPFAFESVKRLMEIRKTASSDTNEFIFCTGNLHGAAILTGVKNLPFMLLEWLKQVLLNVAPEPAPAPKPTTNAPPSTAKPPSK